MEQKKKNIKFPYPPMAARAPIAKALTRIYRQQNTSPKDQSQNSTLLCTHLIIILVLLWPKGGGAVASWLARSSPDRAIRAPSPGRGHCVVFLGKTLNTYKSVPANCWGKSNKLRENDLRWTSSIPSRGTRNTPIRFMLQKPGVSSGSYEPVGSKASFFLFFLTKRAAKSLIAPFWHRIPVIAVNWDLAKCPP